MGLWITVAGQVSVQAAGLHLGGDLGPRARLALAYLVVERHRPVPRHELAEVLWEEELPPTWEASLRGVLSRVRAVLSAAGLPASETLTAASGCYRLQLPPDAVVDVEEATKAADAAQAALGAGDAAAAARAAARAASIAAGGFLVGDRGRWVEGRQAELAETRLRSLEMLATASTALGDHAAAVAAAQEAVGLAPLRESAHRCLVAARARAGNRGEALRAYARCRHILAEELGVSPSPETEAAYLALLREDPPPPPEPAGRRRAALPPPPPPPLPAPLAGPDPFAFAGRHPERTQLRQAWKRAAAGDLVIALVAGEAGMGKTRLAAEAARAAHGEGGLVLYGRCDEDVGTPYQPFAQALGTYLTSAPPDDLINALGPLAGELAHLTSAGSERVPMGQQPYGIDPDAERWRLFEAVTGALGYVSAAGPSLLVLDDLHWAPKPTLFLLRHLARAQHVRRLLVIATYRHDDLRPGHPLEALLADLRRDAGIERLTLGGLDVDDVTVLLEDAVDRRLDPRSDIAAVVHAETGGNPFFVGEIVRHLAETGALATLDHRRGPAAVGLGVPAGVRDVVAARLTRLSDADRDLLALAAIKGKDFDLDLLVAASDASEDAVLDALERAEAGGLVMTCGPRRFRFAHALVRAALEESLPTTRRTRSHRRLARALEARAGPHPGPLLEELALHYWHAAPLGEAAAAVTYGRQAGDRAAARGAYEEASVHYRRALSALALVDQPDPGTRCDLEIALGDSLHRAGDTEFRAVLSTAAASARTLGDGRRLARAALAFNLSSYESEAGRTDEQLVSLLEEAVAALGESEPTLRARLLAVLASELTWSGDADRRTALSHDALTLARRAGDPHTLAAVLAAHHWAAGTPANLAERLAVSAELVALGEELGDPQTAFRGHWYGYWDRSEAGDAEGADADLDAADDLSRRLGLPAFRWDAIRARAAQALLAGRLEEAEQLIFAAAQVGGDAGVSQSLVLTVMGMQLFALRHVQGRLNELREPLAVLADPARPWLGVGLAAACCRSGELEKARALFEAAAAHNFDDVPRDPGWLPLMSMLGGVCADLGDAGRAALLYQRLAPFSGRLMWSNAFQVGPVDHTLGLLAAAAGRIDTAESHFASAAELCQRMAAPCYLAMSWAQWAELLAQNGAADDRARGHRLADQARQLAEPRGMTGVIGQLGTVLQR